MKKDDVSVKKRLRVPGTNLRTPFNGNADKQRQTPDGPDGSGNAEGRQRGVRLKSEVNEAGRAEEVRAHPVIFVSTLFEIDNN